MSRPEIHVPLSNPGTSPPPIVSSIFAPKYVIGNVLAGDPNTSQTGAFTYIPDPGDGSGLAAALALPGGIGDIWLRPGLYDLGTGSVTTPLAVPAGVTIRGSGSSTIVRAGTTAGQGVFTLLGQNGLYAMQVIAPQPSAPLGGPTALISIAGDDCEVSDLLASINPNVGDALQNVLQIQPSLAARIVSNHFTSLNANNVGFAGICDLAGSQVVFGENVVTAKNGNFCVTIGGSNCVVTGNVLNAAGGTPINNTGVNNTTAPNTVL